jgi:hypothetical protein
MGAACVAWPELGAAAAEPVCAEATPVLWISTFEFD